jgi:hypothetical protein
MLKALCLFRDQLSHIKPVEEALQGKVQFIYDALWDEKIIDIEKPDIVIGINEFHIEVAKCYEKASERNIPTLTMQDGILEWRFMFQNELYDGNESGVPMHHPVLADKYACIGLTLANVIASLGNEHRVEIVGMPKLDQIKPIALKPISHSKTNVLIITAAKPWFNNEQKKVILTMLSDLKNYFNTHKQYKITWRITKLLDKELNVESSFGTKSTHEIVDQINEADLVISTTSTAILEAMRCGKPVAKIDYFNLPDMLQTAWSIRSHNDIHQTVQQMIAPSEQQCWYQNYLLNTQCVNDTKASNRTAELILKMIQFKKESKEALPSKIISINKSELAFSFPSDFYPKREVLQHSEMDWLKAKLLRLELRNSLLNKQLNKRGLGHMLVTGYSKILKLIKK